MITCAEVVSKPEQKIDALQTRPQLSIAWKAASHLKEVQFINETELNSGLHVTLNACNNFAIYKLSYLLLFALYLQCIN